MRRRLLVALLASTVCFFWHAAAAEDAADLLHRSEITRGISCVLGATDDSLPVDLAQQSELLVHVLDPDAGAVSELRSRAAAAGLSIQRLLAQTGSVSRLPYADNCVDLLICADSRISRSLAYAEVIRALRPEGVALVAVTGDQSTFESQVSESVAVDSWSDDGQRWIRFSKAVPKGLDEWTHWEKSPDNNPVSSDSVIKAPYMTQFMAKPWYIGMPAVTTAAGGRTFLAMGHIAHHEREWGMLNRLIARNGYNGTILWERQLPDDYLVHRSAFVATRDTFYLMNGDHCVLLDARTGEEQGTIRIPGIRGDWKWMAIQNGVLYALAGAPGDGVELVKGDRALGGWSWSDLSKGYYGKRIPHGFGDVVAAYDLSEQKVLWTHREDTLIDSRGLAIEGDRFFVYCPDRHFRCLDRETGAIAWTTSDASTLELIEEPGKGLTSTPGWRTQTLVVATPDALVVQGQTRMNVIGVSTADGSLLWHRKKVTNNPNAIYVDGKVVLGVGERGSHLVIDPRTGTVEDTLKFYKRACTRLTASPDSFFVRGEGMTRFDRAAGNVLIDGAVRPACNDGVIPAHGLLYLGPWACDCNLSLIGNVARCSAGDFNFDREPTTKERLEIGSESEQPEPFEVSDLDWATYRGNLQRSGSSRAKVGRVSELKWHYHPERSYVPCDPSAANGLVFATGEDGIVRALDAETGHLRWQFQTGGPVKFPPTIAHSRVYVGSGDGYAYCLEAATGRALWRFRAAPVERQIMVYGSLCSTWPVNTGVLVHEGTAYFAAGIVDHDGTYVYAVDAETGELVWHNNSSGHLSGELRKGISVQGNLTIAGDELLMAGGNVVSPARFDLRTGRCREEAPRQGQPQSNGGRFLGRLDETRLVFGGRILYSAAQNVSTKGSFQIGTAERRPLTLNYGGIPPAWNVDSLVVANFKYGRVTSLALPDLKERIDAGFDEQSNPGNRFSRNLVSVMSTRNQVRWQSNLGDDSQFEALSLAMSRDAVLAVARYQDLRRAVPQYFLAGLAPTSGRQLFQQELPGEPLPGGLIVDRAGRVIVALINGDVVTYGPGQGHN